MEEGEQGLKSGLTNFQRVAHLCNQFNLNNLAMASFNHIRVASVHFLLPFFQGKVELRESLSVKVQNPVCNPLNHL